MRKKVDKDLETKAINKIKAWRKDWPLFAKEALGANLDQDQQNILRDVQNNKMIAVASGTARGKDFVAAVACICFLYLTPVWNDKGELVKNTKVAMTAPSGRQVQNIMVPEISRLFRRARERGVDLPGRLVGNDIRTESEEWFLTGFKADDHNHEAWTGFHAANTMFVVTEASGISENIFSAIEGNLQGNSRLLIVFNPNIALGYAASAMRNGRFKTHRLNSLNAPNVLAKKEIIPGQVDYEWVKDKVDHWCELIPFEQVNEGNGDFEFEGNWYSPNDDFRKKVLGMFPLVSEDVLIPLSWIEIAEKRWLDTHHMIDCHDNEKLLGCDVAGEGRDQSVLCERFGSHVRSFKSFKGTGSFIHMQFTGIIKSQIQHPSSVAMIDTIGEGAGVYSRLQEQKVNNIVSAKASHSAKGLKDITGINSFPNMRSYMAWAVRDWLNPINKMQPTLPPNATFKNEATNIKYRYRSDGMIEVESKEDIKKRIKGSSTDFFDALALTFYPANPIHLQKMAQNNAQYF